MFNNPFLFQPNSLKSMDLNVEDELSVEVSHTDFYACKIMVARIKIKSEKPK